MTTTNYLFQTFLKLEILYQKVVKYICIFFIEEVITVNVDYTNLDLASIRNTPIWNGVELLEKEQLDEAIISLEESSKMFPNSYECFVYLGIAYAKKSFFNRAIGAFKKACDLKTISANAHYNLGLAYEGAGILDEALKEFNTAHELNPAHSLSQEKIIELAQIIPEERRKKIKLIKTYITSVPCTVEACPMFPGRFLQAFP